ncbi:hydrogenase maturation protease [Marinobacterium arenosum]|uniref:hydrogenase maturation protease n=1 Tax=Marinobacterium arenosum TaxID=2862496 RepID=UPI001C982924|nr:hydrogenase maturation protease [Marinobacterium arenosum]MBY4676133.1 hydrogenase maturation protease [Marinobacterium arenosum]
MTKIIAIGSPHGDDRFGWVLLQRLVAAGVPAGLELTALDRPGPGLLQQLSPERPTLLVDAVDAGLPPGQLLWLTPDQLPSVAASTGDSHGIGLLDSLQLATALGKPLPPLQLLLCQLQQVQPMAELSPAIEAALEPACAQVEQWLTANNRSTE